MKCPAVVLAFYVAQQRAKIPPEYCCERAWKTEFLSHDADCRIHDPQRNLHTLKIEKRRFGRPAHEEDIGQGEGCEGGRCKLP